MERKPDPDSNPNPNPDPDPNPYPNPNRFFVRQDGTRAYYFEAAELRALVESRGFETVSCDVTSKVADQPRQGRRYCPWLPVAARYWPLLPVTGRYCPSLAVTARCCPLLPVTVVPRPLLAGAEAHRRVAGGQHRRVGRRRPIRRGAGVRLERGGHVGGEGRFDVGDRHRQERPQGRDGAIA